MVLLLKLMEFLKTRRRGFIGCLMSMEKVGEKAANQLKVQDGDEIKFYQEKYN